MGQISSAALITPKTRLGTVQIARKQKEMNNARAHGGSQEASGALEVASATKTIRVMFVSVHVATSATRNFLFVQLAGAAETCWRASARREGPNVGARS